MSARFRRSGTLPRVYFGLSGTVSGPGTVPALRVVLFKGPGTARAEFAEHHMQTSGRVRLHSPIFTDVKDVSSQENETATESQAKRTKTETKLYLCLVSRRNVSLPFIRQNFQKSVERCCCRCFLTFRLTETSLSLIPLLKDFCGSSHCVTLKAAGPPSLGVPGVFLLNPRLHVAHLP